ncbi:MAG: ATP-binding protein [Pseudomonadota bacterium]
MQVAGISFTEIEPYKLVDADRKFGHNFLMAGSKKKPLTLAEKIRASANDGAEVQTPLATNDRIIARVTDGIYREPWAAFRELIANSYDADAKSVVVETGAPEFDKIVIRDDGNGMSPDTLAYVLQNIGGSSKRTQAGELLHTVSTANRELSPKGRPLIGKIGIGLFAVAQLTQHFQIITKAKGERLRSSATVLLKTHNEQNMAKMEPGEEYTAGIAKIISEEVNESELDSQGTTIVLYELRPEIRKSMQSLQTWQASLATGPDGKPVAPKPIYHSGILPNLLDIQPNGLKASFPWGQGDSSREKFAKLADAAQDASTRVSKPANLDHFDEYLKLIWKLSLSLPLKYIGQHPFDFKGSSTVSFFRLPRGKGQAVELELSDDETLREQLGLKSGLSNNEDTFDVFVDDVLISRPIRLPETIRKQHRIGQPVVLAAKVEAPFSAEDFERSGGELSFEAYLYWNSQIVPKDTAGVLVRVKEASGTLFDQRFFNYQVSEQTRLGQITAEIFVLKGLDGAINIDRESFNYSHPHYLYIQKWMHKALRLLVNRLKAIAKEDKSREDEKKRQASLAARIGKANAIWEERLGADSELPLPKSATLAAPVKEVGNTTIDWPEEDLKSESEIANALAIVLQAYGVLDELSPEDRGNLIKDIIEIFSQ